MNLRQNNKGMTLVEMIISILILGIIGVSFAECFVSTTRILNRATLYKNESAKAAEAVEVQDTSDTDYVEGSITFVVNRGTEKVNIVSKGDYIINKVEGNSDETGLKYKEFLAGNSGSAFNGLLAEPISQN